MKKINLLVLCFTILLVGCNKNEKKVDNINTVNTQNRIDPDNKPHEKEMECCPKVEETTAIEIVKISGEKLQEIQNDKKEKEFHLVIDLRSESEYKKGHLKYAINMPAENFEKNIGRIRDWSRRPIILYSNTEEDANLMAELLLKDGFKKIYVASGVSEFNYDYVTYTNLTGSEFQKIIDKKEGIFIDSRDEKDFNKAHVKNAIRIDYKNLLEEISKISVDKNSNIYLYDYTGDRSVEIATKLQELGYENIIISIDGTKETQFYFNN